MAINSYWRPGDWEYAVNPNFGQGGSPMHDQMANNSGREGRSGYFANWLGQQNYLGTDMNSDFARSLLDRFEQGYSAGQFENPDLKWTDYLDTWRGKIGDLAAGTDPQSRGVDARRYSGDARWLQRGW